MNIKGVEHIAINVIDYERSIDFYGRVLGFEQLALVDRGESSITYFALPDGRRLELFDYHGKSRHTPLNESDSGLRHIAFLVEDVAANEAALRSEGVEITLSTCNLPALGMKVLLFLDPNGITLEFCEHL